MGKLWEIEDKRNRHIGAFGITRTAAEWARDPRCKVNAKILRQRIDRDGLPPEEAITRPGRFSKYDKETWQLRRRLKRRLVNLKWRCYSDRHPQYKDYGGRGITIHQGWMENTDSFVDYMIETFSLLSEQDMKGIDIDRIDNDSNYEPGNIQLSTRSENTRNTRRTAWITAWGETKTQAEWLVDHRCDNVSQSLLRQRINRGWKPEEAISLRPAVGRNSR